MLSAALRFIGLFRVPIPQQLFACLGIDRNIVLPTSDGGNKFVVLGLKVDVNFDVGRHVTFDASILNGGRQILTIATVPFLVTSETSVFAGHATAGGLVRVMAGDTGHRLAVLKALTALHKARLIGNVIVFMMMAYQLLESVFQRCPGTVGKSGDTSLHGIAVTLAANFDLALSVELAWVNDVFCQSLLGMRPVKIDMVLGRSMA